MYTLINNIYSDEFKSFSRSFITSRLAGFDIETDGLDPYINNILLVQVAFSPSEVFIFDVFSMDKSQFIYAMQLLEGRKELYLIGHNIKFDLKFIASKTGVELPRVFDTMLNEVLINQGLGDKFYSLKFLVKKYLDMEMNKEVRDLFLTFTGEFSEEQLEYSARDVEVLFAILEKQKDVLKSQGQIPVMELENSVIPATAQMELEGISMNEEKWRGLESLAREKAFDIEKEMKDFLFKKLKLKKYSNIMEVLTDLCVPVTRKRDRVLYESLGIEFGIDKVKELIKFSSPKQTVAILNLLGIKVESSSEKSLVDHKDKEFIKLLLSFREQNKKATSFGIEFLEKLHPITRKLHTSMNQLGTDSGRYASSAPNLLQIPAEKEYRDCFIPEPGWKFIDFDYSGQELRIAAKVFNEPVLKEAFKNERDIHTLTATLIYDKIESEISKAERQKGKILNFGVIYGLSAYGLHKNFGFGDKEAEEILRKYKASYPDLFHMMERFGALVTKHWFSVTDLGRKRYFEKRVMFSSSNEESRYRSSVIREGCNHRVQGGAADITKTAISYIYHRNPFGKDLRIVLSIHDEVLCKVKEEIAEEASKFIQSCMIEAEQEFLGEVPAKVEPVNYLEAISDVWKH